MLPLKYHCLGIVNYPKMLNKNVMDNEIVNLYENCMRFQLVQTAYFYVKIIIFFFYLKEQLVEKNLKSIFLEKEMRKS